MYFRTTNLPVGMLDKREYTCWEPLVLVIVPLIKGGGAEDPDNPEGLRKTNK